MFDIGAVACTSANQALACEKGKGARTEVWPRVVSTSNMSEPRVYVKQKDI